jgi:transposase
VSGIVPGVERQPLKKPEPDATALLRLIERWRNEAVRAGRPISRIALAYEAGRDGFWLARWLIARGIEAHVIHSASVAVSRERKRAKTDRLDAAMLMRVFLGWLRGAGTLRDGGNPDDGGRGCEAHEPRALHRAG